MRRAILYLVPNISNSAMTLSRITGTHFARRQSIIPCTTSILFLIEKLRKLVSTITWYGGPSCVLCAKNNADGVWSLRVEMGTTQLEHVTVSFPHRCWKTYTWRGSNFVFSSFSLSSRFFWTDFLRKNVLQMRGWRRKKRGGGRGSHSGVSRADQALYSSKFAGLFRFYLSRLMWICESINPGLLSSEFIHSLYSP